MRKNSGMNETSAHQLFWPKWLKTYDHLGSQYPFYAQDEPFFCSLNIGSLLDRLSVQDRKIDIVGVVELLTQGHLLGDRTLVRGVRRAPWMGRPSGRGGWDYAAVPDHGNSRPRVDEVVKSLKKALHREAVSYLDGKTCAGILLSGGLDSRIVAGIVRELQLSREFSGDVVALTWGVEGCRDVVYASEIAKRYGWEWLHFSLGPEVLEENIRLAGRMGSEFAPFHLHAMRQVADLDGIDAILAGSYGDSVGRAEFSGRHVLQLNPTVPRSLNRFGVLRDNLVQTSRRLALEDAYGYRRHASRESDYQYRELERQIHYMRRQLSGAMGCIAEKIPLFQMFTAPETFGLMWSLDMKIRDDRFYAALLPTLPGEIGALPWARTGFPISQKEGVVDSALQRHHNYGLWLRKDLRRSIVDLVNSDSIRGLRLFNDCALDKLMRLWAKANTSTTNSIDELISSLAGLSVFVKTFNIQASDSFSMTWRDRTNALSGFVKALAYQAVREWFRP